MFKKLLLVICLVVTLNNAITPAYQELSELSITLNQLENINSKFIIPFRPQIIARYPVPSQEFYTNLEGPLKEAINGNSNLLDAYSDNPSVQVAKYMVAITSEKKNKLDLSTTILLLVQLFDRVQAIYRPIDKLIITSIASGDLANEKILLQALSNFGYKTVKFSAIDPEFITEKALNNFKADPSLNNYEYHYFKSSKSYIDEVMKINHEIPDICITFSPSLFQPTGPSCPLPCNVCIDKPPKTLTTFLLMPNNIDEISIATTDQNFVDQLNQYLITTSDLGMSEVKAKALQSFRALNRPQRIVCDENVLLEFLEIVKLASSPAKDCIAYHKGYGIDTYHNIAAKSIAQLYLETPNMNAYFKALRQINLNDFKIWTYNSHAKQFEEQRV